MGMSQVSRLAILCLADLCGCGLGSIVSTAGSNDPIGTFRVVSMWLCDAHAFEVGCSTFRVWLTFAGAILILLRRRRCLTFQ